jgi:hypothetical protein
MSAPLYYGGNPQPPRQTWAGVLILSCLAIGLLCAMFELECSQVNSERDEAKLTAAGYVLQQARQEDFGKYLADGNTRLIHLQSSTDAAQAAGLAINQPLHWGTLLCDSLVPLNPGQQYEIWAIGAGGETTRLAGVTAQAGISVYPFQWNSAVSILRIEVNAGARTDGGVLIYAGSLQ